MKVEDKMFARDTDVTDSKTPYDRIASPSFIEMHDVKENGRYLTGRHWSSKSDHHQG